LIKKYRKSKERIQRYKKSKKKLDSEINNKFRDFQREAYYMALPAKDDKDYCKGQINIPTGTGKTLIQRAIHVHDMIDKTSKNTTGIYVIAAHRLTLCNQLFNELCEFIFECGIDCSFIHVGSANFNIKELIEKYGYNSTTTECINTLSEKDITDACD
jgi:CRISPR/Cas system-associated endonuclease/helicase Cas3